MDTVPAWGLSFCNASACASASVVPCSNAKARSHLELVAWQRHSLLIHFDVWACIVDRCCLAENFLLSFLLAMAMHPVACKRAFSAASAGLPPHVWRSDFPCFAC
ncbi:hypothetical protein GQ54DRAFT_81398 [Martensiomyces pterosporus]|nr:hypothetical protein GQ54DRAFT_81398 [Martensiomyces pterosporus]